MNEAPSAAAAARDSARASPPSTPLTAEPRRPWLLALAATLTGLWVLALIALALTAANPPLLNLRQLAQARVILTVAVEEPATGDCRVVEAWTPGATPERIRVSNLPAGRVVAGKEYILPLVVDPVPGPGVYRIVDDPEHQIPPLAYPRLPDVEAQLRAWQQRGP